MEMKKGNSDLQRPFGLYSIENNTKTKYFMFKLINLDCLGIMAHSEFDAYNMSKKMLGQEKEKTGKVVKFPKTPGTFHW